MKTIPAKILFLTLLTAVMFGQYKSDLNHNQVSDRLFKAPATIDPLFSPQRFSMHHSFSYSMLSTGAGSIGLGSYTNTMAFQLRPNLTLSTQLILTQPSLSSGARTRGLTLDQVGYGAQLDYRPTENTYFQFSFQKSPYSQYFSRNPYSVFPR
ncbi:MAG: hypothetical protein GXO90_11565 [FCB group bacterium]|nr:hypothetical protein [FCB group bacterium]